MANGFISAGERGSFGPPSPRVPAPSPPRQAVGTGSGAPLLSFHPHRCSHISLLHLLQAWAQGTLPATCPGLKPQFAHSAFSSKSVISGTAEAWWELPGTWSLVLSGVSWRWVESPGRAGRVRVFGGRGQASFPGGTCIFSLPGVPLAGRAFSPPVPVGVESSSSPG